MKLKTQDMQCAGLLLAVLLTCRPSPGRGCFPPVSSAVGHLPCDRQASRDVRRLVDEIILPRLEGLALPPGCPLSPAADRYRQHEAAKEGLSGGRWRCRQCGKRFLGEAFLDAHLAARHPHLEPPGQSNATCLADWHVALHARHLVPFLEGAGGWAADPLPCRPAAVAAQKAACLELAQLCFGGEHPAFRLLHKMLTTHLCQAHMCDKRRKRSHLQAAVKTHKQQPVRTAVVGATGLAVLALFWLLLWLVDSEGGKASPVLCQGARIRRRLAAAAAAGSQRLVLPSVLREALRLNLGGAKTHMH